MIGLVNGRHDGNGKWSFLVHERILGFTCNKSLLGTRRQKHCHEAKDDIFLHRYFSNWLMIREMNFSDSG